MARILTGIQSTGTPHLGNILGAIKPAIDLANDPLNDSFLFIADMHSLTQIKDGERLKAALAKDALGPPSSMWRTTLAAPRLAVQGLGTTYSIWGLPTR